MIPLALLLVRLALSAVQVVAGGAKIADRAGSRQALLDFGVPLFLAPALSVLLPVTELGIGIALVPATTAWWAAAASLALFVMFLAGIGYNLARGRRPDCHCFGQLHSEPIGAWTMGRSAALAALAALLVVQPNHDAGPSVMTLAGGAAQSVALLSAIVAVAVTLGNGWLLTNIVKQNGRTLLRLETLEQQVNAGSVGTDRRSPPAQPRTAGGFSTGLPVGRVAPAFALPSLDGATVSLRDLLAIGKPVLLLFVNPGCGPCAALLPEAAVWQREHPDYFTLAVVSRGAAKKNVEDSERHGIRPVLLQKDYEVAEDYDAVGTPSAVFIDSSGRIGASGAAGADAIRELVIRVSRPAASARPGIQVGSPAPSVRLAALNGVSFDLAGRRGRSTVLLFWNPSCGFCQRLLPDLRAWAVNSPTLIQDLVFVSTPHADANGGDSWPGWVLLDHDAAVRRSFGTTATPSAVLVNPAGEVASALALGSPDILKLLAEFQQSAGAGAAAS